MSHHRPVAHVWLLSLLALPCCNQNVSADVQAVTVDVPQQEVWVGQKATFFVKLKGQGPFVNAPAFSIPQIPRSVIVRVGDPVVSSEDIEGNSWFIQSHEFALFSQAEGTVEVPSFEVRFSTRDGFVGPAIDHVDKVPATQFQIARPAGSGDRDFLVTTASFELQETWDPQPGKAKQGDIFRRTITQKAENVAGMALAPPPTTASEGVRVYTERPSVKDNTERGDFTGSRTDTLTYLLEQPGTQRIPAIKYVWWNPDSKEFGSKKLPAVSFDVAAQPVAQPSTRSTQAISWRTVGSTAAILLFALAVWQRGRLQEIALSFWRWSNPPERVAARKLIRACRRNDPLAAESAWIQWQNTQHSPVPSTSALIAATTELHRHVYGSNGPRNWRGTSLIRAFRENSNRMRSAKSSRVDSLPPLNPH